MLLTVLAWVIMSFAYSIYLVRFDTFVSTYASLSGLFAAMFFLYLAALVLIFGGEVNRVLIAASCGCSAPRRESGGLRSVVSLSRRQRRDYFADASIASSNVLRPVVGAETSTAMLPGRCSFFHIFMWALGMSRQA